MVNGKKEMCLRERARTAGASIEAELGIVGRGKIIETYPYTEPADAAEFVRRTGVDALAVGIGTHHGMYQAKTNIRLDILKAIHEAVDLSLTHISARTSIFTVGRRPSAIF